MPSLEETLADVDEIDVRSQYWLTRADEATSAEQLRNEVRAVIAEMAARRIAILGRRVADPTGRAALDDAVGRWLHQMEDAIGRRTLVEVAEPDAYGARVFRVTKSEYGARLRDAALAQFASLVSLHLGSPDEHVQLDKAADLPSITYVNCIFENVVFAGLVSAQKARFSNCTFMLCVFDDCSFEGTVFSDCKFVECRFDKCELSGASFLYTLFERTVFVDTWGRELTVASCFFAVGAKAGIDDGGSAFRDCRIPASHWSKTTVFDLLVEGSSLEGVVMDRVQFGRGSTFRDVTFEDALLVGCVLDGVCFEGCTLPDSLLIRTSLAETRFEQGGLNDKEFEAAMAGAELRDCLRAAQFSQLTGVRKAEITTSTPLPIDARDRLAALAAAGDEKALDVF